MGLEQHEGERILTEFKAEIIIIFLKSKTWMKTNVVVSKNNCSAP